ncbi:MAG: MltA domain-containing protein [Sedimentisphaerales bacterium]|nr:MltA domain-containing protein [Sedimentisphaerales bacterium]
MKNRFPLAIASVTIFFTAFGCQKPARRALGPPEYDKALPPGQLALRKITNPADIPDFTDACHNPANLSAAIDNSLNYLKKPSSQRFYPYGDITHQDIVRSLTAFKDLLASGLTGRQLNDAIRQRFDVYESVGCDNAGTVLFTGYYTPIFDGSPVETEQFKYPLYRQPDDLVKDENGRILGRQAPDGSISPYPARAEIENTNMQAGSEIVWLDDPFKVYVTHVQGSVIIRMSDGRLVTYSYAANNGREYVAINKILVSEGKIPSERVNLDSMIAFFRANASLVKHYTQLNPRFVFFRKTPPNEKPRGSLNEPVTPYRSVATDKSIFPRAAPVFFATKLPRRIGTTTYIDPFSGFALDQDTGGAIRAAGRCDIYLGIGDEAGKLAGQTYQEGRLYYLFLKPNF